MDQLSLSPRAPSRRHPKKMRLRRVRSDEDLGTDKGANTEQQHLPLETGVHGDHDNNDSSTLFWEYDESETDADDDSILLEKSMVLLGLAFIDDMDAADEEPPTDKRIVEAC